MLAWLQGSDWKFLAVLIPAIVAAVYQVAAFHRDAPRVEKTRGVINRRPRSSVGITFVLTLMTWAAVIYDVYDRRAVPAAKAQPVAADTSMSGLIQAYGDCTVIIDGARLMRWRSKYQVALICGHNEPEEDKYQVTAISVSTLHEIRPEQIQIVAKHSADMSSALNALTKKVTASLVSPPRGRLKAANIQIWNEVVLFPSGQDLSDIHKLADVHSRGGLILSQDFPKCVLCGGVSYTTTWILPTATPTPSHLSSR